MLTEAYISYLAHEKRYSPHTVEAYKKDLEQFHLFLQRDFGQEEIHTAEVFHVRSWIATLHEDGTGARSIQRKISSLQGYFKFLGRRHGITNNPCKSIVKPKAGKKLPSFIPMQEINKLENASFTGEDSFLETRNRLILFLLYATGIRVSELTGIRVGDIDAAGGTVKVMGKRAKERILPLLPEVSELLRAYLAFRNPVAEAACLSLLVTQRGTALNPRQVRDITKEAVRAAGIASKGNPHEFRHTFATHLLNSGADINAVKELLGHASLAATQVYTHNTIEKLKKIHEQAHPRAK